MTSTVRPIENDALIESSFRRLLAAIESEREKIRSNWQLIEQERDDTTSELERLKQDTEEWCHRERQKIEMKWKELDELHERMSVLWPETTEVLEINCSGQFFSLPKSTLCGVEGSYLNHMFSDEWIGSLPKDTQGRYLLDYNPKCFAIIVEYLQNRRLKANAPIPPIPIDQQQNMDILAEALKLKPFLPDNKLSQIHGTSLMIVQNTIEATHQGWQCITAQRPVPMSGPSYFEVKILANPKPKGGLAVGVIGHIPQDAEIHTIRLKDSIMYNSQNGLIGDSFGETDVTPGIQLTEGATIGVRVDPSARALNWYYNRQSMGTSTLKIDKLDNLQILFPIFSLFEPGQKISVDFQATPPGSGAS
jgi:hypothetical protein